jgi:hypothetical protein
MQIQVSILYKIIFIIIIFNTLKKNCMMVTQFKIMYNNLQNC